MGLSGPTQGDMPPWRPLLKAAQKREGRSPHARWLQLASLGLDGAPRVRTLVFRCWVDAHSLDLFTDGRSPKAAELQADPRLELCWLLPKARCQFRLRGNRLRLNAEAEAQERRRHWHQLSPGARALWGWPPPRSALRPSSGIPLRTGRWLAPTGMFRTAEGPDQPGGAAGAQRPPPSAPPLAGRSRLGRALAQPLSC
jgi:pyridoxamine 5'-phosphate oxidase